MWGIQVAAAAVDVDDPISVPDGTILVRSAGEKECGRMADDTDGIRVGTCAVRSHPAPDASVEIISGETVDEMEVSVVHREVQIVRQTGEKSQDMVSFLGRAVVEQILVGRHSAVLPPQIPSAKFVIGAEGVEAHLLMVAQEHGHIGSRHNLLQHIHTAGAPVNHIPKDV